LAKQLLVEPLAWEFVLERSSIETRSNSVAMERWSVVHRAFAVETYLKNNDSVLTQRIFLLGTSIFIGTNVPSRNTSSSEDISRARCTKRTKDNGGFETEDQGRSGSHFSQHAASSDA
jgi:hypothetical protein